MPIEPSHLTFSYRWGADAIERLVSDVPDEHMAAQPIEAMNHPAWLIGHVSIYNEVIVRLLRGEPFDDPWQQPCGKNSVPSPDRSAYPSKSDLLSHFRQGVEAGCDAVVHAPAAAWTTPLEHPTWGKQFETVAPAVLFLATTHLALHTGQLSGWRRAMKLPRI